MRKSAHPGASAWDVSTLLLVSKPAFYRWLNSTISWPLYNRRNRLPQHFFSTSRCRERRDDEGLYALAVPDLQMGTSIDLLIFGIVDVHVSLPALFVALYHGIAASAFLRLDWVVDEHSEDVSLPERPWRDLDNQALRTL